MNKRQFHVTTIRYRHYRAVNTRSFQLILQASFDRAVQAGQVQRHFWRQCTAKAVTICTIEDANRVPLTYGYAFCSPVDQFSRYLGRKIALNRAQIALEAQAG